MMMPNNGEDSPPIDEANGGGNGQLKKGPWTSAEDAILMEYVMKHGEGNWNAVQKHSGLARCGKSCRLRWANHLRPDLKKGAFSPEEERLIIELHAKMGNKWARMAAELPGRTDNEIKNYWNTRIKRRQRAGLPIYPPDICLQAFNENQHSNNMNNTFSPGDMHHQGYVPDNNIDFPTVEFKGLELSQQMFTLPILDIPASNLLDIPTSSLLGQGGLHCPYPNKTLLSMMHPSKRLRGSEESQFPILSPIPGGGQFQNCGSAPHPQSFLFLSEYDHHNSSVVLPGPPSEPSWAMKMELPSLQTPQMGNWGSTAPSSPVPSIDSVDTLIQTPPTDNLSPQNSGLLDAVLYESQTKKIPRGNSRHHVMSNNSYNNLHDAEWEVYGEQLSPLGHSSSSVFSENTPISANSVDEPNSGETFPGYKSKQDPNNLDMEQYDKKGETADQMIFSGPDFLLDSNCFGLMKDPSKDHKLLKDAIGPYLRDDLSSDCKPMDADTTSTAQNHGPGHNSVLVEPSANVQKLHCV